MTVREIELGPTYWSHVAALRRVPGIDGATPRPTGSNTVDAFKAGLAATPAGQTLVGLISTPSNLTEAVSNVGTGLSSIAQSAMGVGELATLATKAFLPSNLLRGFAMFLGIVFVLIGVWFLAREVREAS